MITLIRFELKKIFDNKLVYISAIAIAFFVLAYPVAEYKEIKEIFTGKEEVRAFAEKYISDDFTLDEIKELREVTRNKIYNNEVLTKDEEFISKYSRSFNKINKGNDIWLHQIRDIDSRLEAIRSDKKENSFEYTRLLKEKDMISNLDNQESVYLGGWNGVFDFNVASTMKIALLVLGLASIFSSEYTSRVAYINLSTKKGKTTLNQAKIIAAFIYASIVFIFVTVLFHLGGLPLGLPNGDKPISFLIDSIYDISINTYYFSTLAFSYLGTLAFATLIVLLSLLSKNILVSFGLTLVLYFLPDMFRLPDVISHYTYNLNFTRLLKGKDIFGGYIVFDVFGKAVLYPYVILAVGIILLIVMLVIYSKFSKKQVIA